MLGCRLLQSRIAICNPGGSVHAVFIGVPQSAALLNRRFHHMHAWENGIRKFHSGPKYVWSSWQPQIDQSWLSARTFPVTFLSGRDLPERVARWAAPERRGLGLIATA